MGEMADVRLSLRNGGCMRVQAIAPGAFRIRMNDTGLFAEPPLIRYRIVNAVIGSEEQERMMPEGIGAELQAGRASLHIDGTDGQFRLYGADGTEKLRTFGPPRSSRSSGFGVCFSLHADEAMYGLGNIAPERVERRGLRVSVWAEKTLWGSAPLPYLMSTRGWAIMMNTTWRHTFDIGSSADDRLSIDGQAGELDMFVFAGSSLAELLHAYTDIAGKPRLMPIWMYGLNFCSRVKSSARDVLDDAIKFRRAGTPCDLIGLNADWMETVNDFSTSKRWHPERFPTSTNDLLRQVSFIGILQKQGFKLSLNLGCDYDLTLLEERLAGVNEAGEGDEKDEPWYDHLRKFVDDGISGFVLSATNPMYSHPDRIWGNGMSSAELHNLYPVLLGKQMHLGFRGQTGMRPVIHMEKGYLGMQQFIVSTTGTFYNAKHAIAAILNYGLSGHVHTSTNMHLITREGIHSDFLLAWSRINCQDHFHHPDFLERPLQELFQRYARLRYRLIPYLYATAHVAARTGMPITRAMPLMFPDDRNCRELSQQYMLGDFLLAAVYTDRIYLPAGEWLDYWTGERYIGPQSFTCRIPPEAGGLLFVRAGAIIPMWPPMDYIGQLQVETVTLEVYPGAHSEFVLYEDDGTTFDYLDGCVARTHIACETSREATTVRISRREGAYAGMARKRSYELIVHTDGKPAAVRVDGQRRPDQTRRVKSDPFRSWRYDRLAGTVRLHVEEAGGEAAEVCIEIVKPARSGTAAGGGSIGTVPAGGKAGDEGDDADGAFIAALDAAGEPRAAEAALAAWWGARIRQGSSDAVWPLHVMNACHLIVRQAARRGSTAEDVFGGMTDTTLALAQLRSPEQGYELLLRLVNRLVGHAEARRPAAKHPVVRELVAIVEREPDRDLSLNTMAERFALHPFHLSRLFKKEIGRAYSDYVMSIRMIRARKLLEAGYKVYEAAALCGFKDAGNFSKAFSKYWGVPPVNCRPGLE
ncbi:DUF5110 domain-containing protein [Paenibacillus mesophilus]|uniref:DUF5110 domain-containing protein n=1 Tax=Paenibacillus mesophilus TaxID=2582849 RepID=UPI00110F4E93|nr:DUF5110 domain-containing protein [Paenibacillus mesophilus]TMV45029.1 DUF5110 domain-containing protein [Paenibacillus mesophilus]